MSFDKTTGRSSVYSPNLWYHLMIHINQTLSKKNMVEHEASGENNKNMINSNSSLSDQV